MNQLNTLRDELLALCSEFESTLTLFKVTGSTQLEVAIKHKDGDTLTLLATVVGKIENELIYKFTSTAPDSSEIAYSSLSAITVFRFLYVE